MEKPHQHLGPESPREGMAPENSQQLQASVPKCAMNWTLWQAAPCALLGFDHTRRDGCQTPHQDVGWRLSLF